MSKISFSIGKIIRELRFLVKNFPSYVQRFPKTLQQGQHQLQRHFLPFLHESWWHIKHISATSALSILFLVALATTSTSVSLAIFAGSGAENPLKIDFSQPKRSSSLTFHSKESSFSVGQPTTTTVQLDTGGAIITRATVTIYTDPSLVELNTIAALGGACSQLTNLVLNKTTGELTFRCDSILLSKSKQIVDLVTVGLTPIASATGYLTFDPIKTKLIDSQERQNFRPAAPFALTITKSSSEAAEQYRVPTTALNLGLSGCVSESSASIRWIKPVLAKNIEYSWTTTGIPQTPSTPSTGTGSNFPLKNNVVHIATIRATDGKGFYGPTSVVRVASCP